MPSFPLEVRLNREFDADRGVVGSQKFDRDQLTTMKMTCEPNCFSTLNHIVGWCYNDARVMKWMLKRARHGFQGIRGNLE